MRTKFTSAEVRRTTILYRDSAFHSALMEALSERLDDMIDRLGTSGRDANSLGDAAEIADRMVAAIPWTSPHNLQLGPYYTTKSLATWLGVSRQYILEVTKQRRFISMTTADGHRVYPSFQFGTKGASIRELPRILAILERHLSPATSALWLASANDDLNAMTPAAWILAGRDEKVVIVLAERYMELFAGEPRT
jgi:hypothetical protein